MPPVSYGQSLSLMRCIAGPYGLRLWQSHTDLSMHYAITMHPDQEASNPLVDASEMKSYARWVVDEVGPVDSEAADLIPWGAAHTMAKYLHDSDIASPGKTILELGAGCGMPGLVAALSGASVVLTDKLESGSAKILNNLKRNALENSNAVQSNGGSVAVAQLDWGNQDHSRAILDLLNGQKIDSVIGCDILYDHTMVTPLLETINHLNNVGNGSFSLLLGINDSRFHGRHRLGPTPFEIEEFHFVPCFSNHGCTIYCAEV